MKLNNNFVATQLWISRATLLAILAGFITACDNRANNRDTAVVSPSPSPTNTVVISPSPAPTTTVVVTPTPIPTTTVVVTPTPIPTRTVVVTPTLQASPAPTVVLTEPITDLGIISTTQQKQTLSNKRAQLTNVTAQSVVGDRTFWVGSSNTQQLFVVLAPRLDQGSAENKIVVKPGQTLNLSGVLKPMPSQQQAQTEWGLSAAEAQTLRNQSLYLEAEQIKF